MLSIPKGFRPKAQGCEERATLGKTRLEISNPNGVAALRRRFVSDHCRNPVGVGDFYSTPTQGSSFLATLGFETESLWD